MKSTLLKTTIALVISLLFATQATSVYAQGGPGANAKINSVWQSVGFRTRTGTLWNNYGNFTCRSYTEQNGAWYNGLQMNYTLGKYVTSSMIFEQQFYFYNGTKDNSLDSYVKIGYMSSPFELISSEYQQLSAGAGLWTLYFKINTTENTLNGYYHLFPEGIDLFRMFPDECINSGSLTIWETWNVNNSADILNAINQQKSYLENISGEATSIAGHAWQINNSTQAIVQKLNELENKSAVDAQNNEINSGEQAQTDGQNASNQSQADATAQGQSLISGAANIIGALTDTTAGSCNINLNMGILDMGTQNFCQGDIGPIRPIIATITNVLFAFVSLRVFIFLIGVMFGLFDQFLGTKTETGGTNG